MRITIKAAAAAVIAIGLALGGTVGAASAHTGNLTGTPACQTDGTWSVSWSGSTNSVPDSGPGHVAELTASATAGTTMPAVQNVTGNTGYTFTTTGIAGGTKTVSATASLKWGDGHTEQPTASVRFTTNCEPPKHDPVTICHKPGTPAQQQLTVDDSAAPAHLEHGDTLGECPPVVVIPGEPALVVTGTSSEATDCEARVITTTTVTTTQGWRYDATTNTWVATEPVSETTTSERPADLTVCPAPPKPEPIVEYGGGYSIVCGVGLVSWGTTTTTDWVLAEDGYTWVKAEPVTVRTEQTVEATEDEYANAECPKAPLVEVTEAGTAASCEAPGESTRTTTTTTYRLEPYTDSVGTDLLYYAPNEPTSVVEVLSTTPALECITPAAQVDKLAYTGTDSAGLMFGAGSAALLMLAGIVAITAAKLRTPRYRRTPSE